MDGWMDGLKNMKKNMDGWMDKKYRKKIDGWLDRIKK